MNGSITAVSDSSPKVTALKGQILSRMIHFAKSVEKKQIHNFIILSVNLFINLANREMEGSTSEKRAAGGGRGGTDPSNAVVTP